MLRNTSARSIGIHDNIVFHRPEISDISILFRLRGYFRHSLCKITHSHKEIPKKLIWTDCAATHQKSMYPTCTLTFRDWSLITGRDGGCYKTGGGGM